MYSIEIGEKLDSFIGFVAEYSYIGVMALVILFLGVRYRARWLELLIATVIIGGIGYLLSKVGTNLISDPRPFVQNGTIPLIHSATDNGFPSDHTLLLATAAVIVVLVNRWAGAVVLALALLIGLARVYVGVHHLLDILGSFAIVAIAALIYLGGREIWQHYGSPLKQGIRPK